MFRLLKKWIIARLLSDEDIANAEAAKVVHFGTTVEARHASWLLLQNMLESQPGLLWQAMMQREVARLQQLMLNSPEEEKRKELLFRWRQMAWVCSYPEYVKGKITDLEKKVRQKDEEDT
jgi:hypothetical protein